MCTHTHTALPPRSQHDSLVENSPRAAWWLLPSTPTLSYLDPQGGNFQDSCLLRGQNLPRFIDPRRHKEMKGGLVQQVTQVLARFDHNIKSTG